MDAMVQHLDREISAVEEKMAALAAQKRALVKARALLAEANGGTRRRKRAKQTSVAKAGPAAIAKIQTTLTDEFQGRASQAALTKATGLNSGQVSAAIKHLETAGVLHPTEEKEGRSIVYERTGVSLS